MANVTGKIDAFIDCVSPYSFYATTHLLKNRDALLVHGVEIEIHPVFLGGIMSGSGNKPPWFLPAKAKYMDHDDARAKKYFNLPNARVPSFFPVLTLLPLRALTYIKAHHARNTYEQTFLTLFSSIFIHHLDISQPANLQTALTSTSLFTAPQVSTILAEAATNPTHKEKLAGTTQKALDYGAFGAPWFWVRNKAGEEAPFFGSDRWVYMWDFLGVPFRDVEILEKGGEVVKGKL